MRRLRHTSAMDTAPAPAALSEIVVLNRDLFFGVRIGNTLRDAGYQVTFRPATAPFAATCGRRILPPPSA